MKIAFVGDSFCADIKSFGWSPWPCLVATEFDAEIICCGRGGMALYHSYKELLTVVDEADRIIFCITEPNRLANKHNLPCNDSIGRGEIISTDWSNTLGLLEQETFQEATRNYYNNIISWLFHQQIHVALLRIIDNLIIQKEKKCLFLHCFPTDGLPVYQLRGGPCNNISLKDIEVEELKVRGFSPKQIHNYFNHNVDVIIDVARTPDDITIRKNHKSELGNYALARYVIDIIKADDFSSNIIDLNPYFSLLDNELSNYSSSPAGVMFNEILTKHLQEIE